MNMKKLVSMILALVMMLAMASGAMAAPNSNAHTITITNATSGYTYEAYRVFEGDLVNGELTNIAWSDGVDGAALLAELKTLTVGETTPFANCETAVDVATVLALDTTLDNEVAQAFAAVVANHTVADNGVESTYADGKYTINVTGDGYYFIKTTSVPSGVDNTSYTRYILKVVGNVTVAHKGTVPTVDKEIVGDTTTETGDFNIGDDIEYKLTGTLPSNYADYSSYKYIFHDTLSAGLTYNNDAKVYIVNGDAEPVDVTGNFTITYANQELTVSCEDLTKITAATIDANSKIVVEYTAKLNENAVIGGEGNPNDVYLEYSNDPNNEGDGKTGTTPEDEVVVFTFELDVTKVDGVDNTIKLEGAEFKLQNADGKWVTVDGNGKVTGWVDTQEAGSVLTSNANGFFKIVGLEDGEYKLYETKAPAGYNTLEEPIVIVITSTYDEKEGVKTLTISVDGGDATDGDITNGVVETTVENNSGATLPETGAQGTKMIYMIGGLLVASAAILLITKRRVNAAE